MKYDELAFFNQQLAAMLRDGIPLEGAIKQLCADLKRGPFRDEMVLLQNDLARGTPLDDAIAARHLPELYRRMIAVGARGNDLPGVLTLVADHYERANSAWTRLKGLMVYPLLLIGVSLVLTVLLSWAARRMVDVVSGDHGVVMLPPFFLVCMWVPPIALACLAVVAVAIISVPKWRGRMRWRLPAFRDASLAQVASAMALMLKNGTPLPDALAMAESLESGSPAGPSLGFWRDMVERGGGKPAQWPHAMQPFPPLFMWLVRKGGEDLSAGFQKAADLFYTRAVSRIEMALYAALPVSILLLGLMVFWQVMPVFRVLIWFMNMVSDTTGR